MHLFAVCSLQRGNRGQQMSPCWLCLFLISHRRRHNSHPSEEVGLCHATTDIHTHTHTQYIFIYKPEYTYIKTKFAHSMCVWTKAHRIWVHTYTQIQTMGSKSALLHNGHKRTLKWSYRWNQELRVKSYIKQISCDAKSNCFNPFTWIDNTSRWGSGMVVPSCLQGKHDSTHSRAYIPFHTTGTVYSGGSCVIIDFLWF